MRDASAARDRLHWSELLRARGALRLLFRIDRDQDDDLRCVHQGLRVQRFHAQVPPLRIPRRSRRCEQRWLLRGILMNSTVFRFSNRSRLSTVFLVGVGSVLALLAGCSSDDNPTPSKPPVISTGGGGNGGSAGENDAGESSVGGSTTNGGSGGEIVEDGGAGGEGGESPISPTCPSSDLEFLNQPSNSQKTPFDNDKRLGAAAALPPLP